MSEQTSILIAEDQGMMRSALASLLALEPDLRVVAEVARGDQVIAAATAARPDVVLLDIELPGRSGLDVIEELLQAVPGTRVVVVTTFGRPGYLSRAMAAGARGFLVKDDPVSQLAASIRDVVAGGIVVNPVLAAQALSASPDPHSDRDVGDRQARRAQSRRGPQHRPPQRLGLTDAAGPGRAVDGTALAGLSAPS